MTFIQSTINIQCNTSYLSDTTLEITKGIAEAGGKLKGRYTFLKTIDALQLSAALDIGADAFLTNDVKLQQIKELKVLLLKDYL